MAAYIIGYTIIAIIIIFVVFSILVKKRVLFGNTLAVQKIFAHPLLHYSLRRIGSSLISISLAIIVTFFLVRLAYPADQTCRILFSGIKISEELFTLRCNNWKAELGFSGTTLEQLGTFFYNILPIPKTVCQTAINSDSGTLTYTVSSCRTFVMNFGTIYNLAGFPDGGFVEDYIFPRMMTSFKINIIAVVVELALGYPFGLLMARYQNGIFDKIGKTYIITIDAIPGVAYYYIWMAILCGLFGLPTKYSSSDFVSWLPVILTMGFTGMSGIGLWVRRYMVDEYNADYVKFARSKGLSEGRISSIHILRNAVVPLVRTFPSAVIGALFGSYYLENIYNIDGIGKAITTAINTYNSSLLIAIIMISALTSVISYLLGDIVTALVDPRISLSSS